MLGEHGDDLDRKLEKAKAEVDALKAEKRKRDELKAQIIGRAIMKEMPGNMALSELVEKALHEHVTAKRDRKVLGLSDEGFSDANQPKIATG